MKHNRKYHIMAAMAALLGMAVMAQAQTERPAALREGDSLIVRFSLPPTEVSANQQMTITPIITDGKRQIKLSPIVFTGRIRHKVNERRRRLYGNSVVTDSLFENHIVDGRRITDRRDTIYCEARVPYEKWMGGGEVLLSRQRSGCAGRCTQLESLIIQRIATPVRAKVSFVVPPDDAPKHRSERFAANVHFPQGKSLLLREFADNYRELEHIDSLTARLFGNDTISLEGIFIRGYASPEGIYALNTRLSANRARAIAQYMQENFQIPAGQLSLATVSEDWDSLRSWVARSDLRTRDKVLAAIDEISDPDARDAAIRSIDNGKTYNLLFGEVYPGLRRVDFSIAYRLPPFTTEQCRQIIASHPEWLSLAEFCRVAESYPQDSPERAKAYALASKYYPEDAYACNNMAALSLNSGDTGAARRYLDRCANDPQAQNNLGIVFLNEGDEANAKRCFFNAAERGCVEAAYNLAHFEELVP